MAKLNWFLLPVLLLTSHGFAAESFDAKTPGCELPIFHWTNRPVTTATAQQHILKRVVGAVEANRTKWNPDKGEGDLAGKGMYFAADPVTSQSYGNYLVVAWMKPLQVVKDVRALGELDDPEQTKRAAAAIRSDNPFFVHTWISKLGTADAVVVRSKAGAQAAQIPLNMAASEAVAVDPDVQLAWSQHADVNPRDSIGTVLQKYSDKIIFMNLTWSSFDAVPSDEAIWAAMKSELTEADHDPIYLLEQKHGEDVWESLNYCGEIKAPLLEESVAVLRKANLIGADARVSSSCELKASLIRQWRKGPGYAKYAGVHQYFYQLKKKLGIHKPNGNYAANVSVFSATCQPY